MKFMSPMSTFSIQKPEFRICIFNCTKITASWTMNNRSMDSRFSPTVNSNSDMKNKKKKDELSVSVQLSISPVPKVEESLNSDGLRFDRLQPSDYELIRENRFEFGQFVARDAVLDEEYWVCFMNSIAEWRPATMERALVVHNTIAAAIGSIAAAWLRAESHWENRTYERYDTAHI
ncbi:hypothetical protein KIW84_013704 [Lathyrus oleraceus]|uniref:Uncharacterized protein n=1 Tax=Pisum sativum TaxID=3888 RepID=A0A9D5BKX7_PEA|nr:hypothetical protein KIW84_013704 [Pisum sativum]